MFDRDESDISLNQGIDQRNHFRCAPAQAAELRDDQRIGLVKHLQQLVNPALLAGLARRDRHFDKLNLPPDQETLKFWRSVSGRQSCASLFQ